MSEEEVKRIGFEIAMKGRRRARDQRPNAKISVKELAGRFQWAKYMYVAFKSIAPETDIGFDLSKGYAAAKSMYGGKAVQ